MGAPSRDKPGPPVARPVWFHFDRWWRTGQAPPSPPKPALLLDWRRIQDSRDRFYWEGLILYGGGGGEVPWRVELQWVGAAMLEEMVVSPPGDGEVERPGK